MDNLEYLNHIAQSNRPTRAARASASTSLIIKILLAGLVLFFILLAIGSTLGNRTAKVSDLTKQLYVRTENLNSTLTTYNPHLKSSQLRAIGLSLSGTLTAASSQLSTYLNSVSSSKNALVPNAEIAASEADVANALDQALENAKLNGILDRTYATQIQLQVSLILSMISQLSARADDEELSTILVNYLSSLIVVEESLENYSNPSD